MKQAFVIKHSNPEWRLVLQRALGAVRDWAEHADLQLTLSDLVRTLDQNAAMWPALTDFADQVDWPHTDGQGNWVIGRMPPEGWKAVLTAAFENDTSMAQGLRGGVVMLGARTSKYGKRKMADFLTFIHAEGAERGVVWSERARDKFDEFASRRAA